MKTIVGILIILMPIIGCGDTDKILDSQQETDAKVDSLLALLTMPAELTRKDLIVSRFDSLVAYKYETAQVPTSRTAEDEHDHIEVRYAEYWVFYVNENELYDGDFEFFSHILPGGYRDLKDFEPTYGPDPFDRLTSPDIYQSTGKWRILNEREIDLFREQARFFSFRDYQWYSLPASILGANIFSFHSQRLMFGSTQGGAEFFNIAGFHDLRIIKNGVFDLE